MLLLSGAAVIKVGSVLHGAVSILASIPVCIGNSRRLCTLHGGWCPLTAGSH